LVPENKFLSELILIIDFDSGLSGRFAWNGLKKLEEDSGLSGSYEERGYIDGVLKREILRETKILAPLFFYFYYYYYLKKPKKKVLSKKRKVKSSTPTDNSFNFINFLYYSG
jgi:hypothetical protein